MKVLSSIVVFAVAAIGVVVGQLDSSNAQAAAAAVEDGLANCGNPDETVNHVVCLYFNYVGCLSDTKRLNTQKMCSPFFN